MRRFGLLVLLAVGCAHAPGFLFREVRPADWVVAEGEGGKREVLLRSEFERQIQLGLRERPKSTGPSRWRYGIDDEVALRVGQVRTFPLLEADAKSVAVRGEDAAAIRVYLSLPVDYPVQTAEGPVRRRRSDLHLEAVAPGRVLLLLRGASGSERRVTVKVSRE